MAVLKDSGARRTFETGATRDISDDKGRCDLIPLDIIGKILEAEELVCIENFKQRKDPNYLIRAIEYFAQRKKVDLATLFLEVSFHFRDGAIKYSENNWMKGMPLHNHIDSGVRHFLQYLRGDIDEPHDRAFVWNMIAAIWTFSYKPELDDIYKDIGPSTHNKFDELLQDPEV